MNHLRERLDRLAGQATVGLELLPPELAVAARRQRRRRLRVVVLSAAVVVVGGVAAGLVTSSQHAMTVNVGNQPSQGSSSTAHLAPLTDTALTPPGWSPVEFGPIQISVPSAWMIEPVGFVCQPGIDGQVFLNRQPAAARKGLTCTDGIYAPNVVAIVVSAGSVPHASAKELNAIAATVGWSQNGSTRTEIVRALGHDITATGPMADHVMATLTHSPLSVVINSEVIGLPAGWRSVSFGGLKLAVPKAWHISHSSGGDGCAFNLTPNVLQLNTPSQASSQPSTCGGPLPTAGYEAGVAAMLVQSEPAVAPAFPDSTCIRRFQLQICLDPPIDSNQGELTGHGPAILTAEISHLGQATLDQIEIGLSGDGTTALHIFDSLRPAT